MGRIDRILDFLLGKPASKTAGTNNLFDDSLSKIIAHNQINVIFDVGASIGSFIRLVRNGGYKGKIIAFEPLREPFLALSQFAKDDLDCKCYQIALGAKNGLITNINVSHNSVSSSLLPILPRHLKSAPDSYITQTEQVEVKCLDSFCAGLIKPTDRVFIKIDVQGYEKEVLAGAKETLRLARLIQVELSCVPLYEGQPLYQEMLASMLGAGFDLVLVYPVFNDPVSGHMLQFDAVFERKG